MRGRESAFVTQLVGSFGHACMTTTSAIVDLHDGAAKSAKVGTQEESVCKCRTHPRFGSC